MRYRAVAVASERTNAVGAVELECTPHGLFVAYLGVGAFSEGYAPGALTSGTGLTIPWANVNQASIEGERVFLALEPRLTPHNRLLLTHFGTGARPPNVELRRRRSLVRIGTSAAALCVALLTFATLVRLSPETSASAAIFIAVIASLALVALGWLVEQQLDDPGAPALARFGMELEQYLPTLVRLPAPPPRPRPLLEIERLQGFLPRTTFAVVITLSAGALSVLLVARWVTTSDEAVQRVEERARALQPAPAEPAPPPGPKAPAAPLATSTQAPAATPAAIAGAACRCDRPHSLLWADPLPRLSVLTWGERVRRGRGAEERASKQYLELEVAVVNNSKDPIDEVSLLVLFYERDPPPSNRRSQVSNRSLFYDGTLGPGQAIKWSVEAEGMEAEVVGSVPGGIGPNGEDAAPTQRIFELLSARNRPVRLHGAMLLAFLGDPRAREGVLSLREALRDDEAPYLTRLIHALSEVRVCELRIDGSGARRRANACLFNSGKVAQRDLGIKLRGLERALDPARPVGVPPTVLVEAAEKIPGELAPDTGRRVAFDFDVGANSPERYEAMADRYDLLR